MSDVAHIHNNVYHFNAEFLNKFDSYVVVTALHVIKEIGMLNASRFDEQTEQYLGNHFKESVTKIKSSETNINFGYFHLLLMKHKQIFSTYIYSPEKIFSILDTLWQRQELFPDLTNVSSIQVILTHPSSTIDVTDLSDLIERYGKAVMLHVGGVICSNYQYQFDQQKLNLFVTLSDNYKTACFDYKMKAHPTLKFDQSKDQLLADIFYKLGQIINVEDILKIVLIQHAIHKTDIE